MKKIFSIFILFVAAIGAGSSIYRIATGDNLTNNENLLLSLLLTICASLISWIITDFYAGVASRKESSELIDRIGEQSSEKILNQSRQLWNVETYLINKKDVLGKEESATFLPVAEAVIEMIKLIRSSNNTYLSDWAGVVSEKVRARIDDQARAQAELFEDIEVVIKGGGENHELKERILSNISKLPSYLAPSTGVISGNLVSILRQDMRVSKETKSQGELVVRINRPSFSFTATGKLRPHLVVVPNDVRARLVKYPRGTPKNIRLHASTGTVHDFHIHLKSGQFNVYLPPGEYTFQYICQVLDRPPFRRHGKVSKANINTGNADQSSLEDKSKGSGAQQEHPADAH